MNGTNLPITAFRAQIVKAVRENPVTVITAETGAGKSTQVPQYLLDEGYDLVVTQPRRLAARTVAQRVAEEMGEKLGGTIGYRTAVDRQDSSATRCLFCTDGLALVRELMGQNRGILVLDEVHEWNENIEVLVAWAKHQIAQGADFKVVLMSATLEAEKLAAFFDDAPVIEVPGRPFPVEEKQAGRTIVDDVARLVAEGRNVLVFQPGKAEIDATCRALEQSQVNAEILPLHGQLSPEEQARCFRHYGRPKVVVATNVAQTSVTIDDIDAVVDSGMERRIELVDGVEGLYLKAISLADATQRKGRAGRTKAGIYIDHCNESMRPDFPVAEILRKRLDQTVLRLAIAGFDMEELAFFHQPEVKDIHDARQSIINLGCMTKDGEVTKIGRLVNRLPVSVQYGRMLVEADRLGVVDDVLTVAAILEMGGITIPPPSRNQPDRPDWRRMVPGEIESDVMGQLKVWEMADEMTKDQMWQTGISLRDYFRAKEIRRRLAQAVRQFFQFGTSGKREDILKAVCAGMVDHLYKGSYGRYRNGEDVERELGSASVVRGGEWIVGKPFDLQISTRRGKRTLRLIELASKVDPLWLTEIAPQLVEEKAGLRPRYNSQIDSVESDEEVYFNGQLVGTLKHLDASHPDAADVFARWLSSQSQVSDNEHMSAILTDNAARQQQARQLNLRSGEETFKVYSNNEVYEKFVVALSGARRVAEVQNPEALSLPILDEKMVERVLREQPSVKYDDRYGHARVNPQVTLTDEIVEGNHWLKIPDKGVFLPGGRRVEIVVSFGYYKTIADTDIPQLKEKVTYYLNLKQWDSWNTGKPEIALPDPAIEDSEVPFVTAVYGQCVVTGVDLIAFGTVTTKTYRYYHYDPYFEVRWFRDRVEAEQARSQASSKLESLREESRRQAGAKVKLAEVRKMWEEIDIAKYVAYGLTPDEAGHGYYRSRSIEGQIESAESRISSDHARALKDLSQIEARILEVQQTWNANQDAAEEAQDLLDELGLIKDSFDEVRDDLSYAQEREFDSLFSSAQSAYDRGEFSLAKQKAEEAREAGVRLVTKVQEKHLTEEMLSDLLANEYSINPITGDEMSFSRDRDVEYVNNPEAQTALITRAQYQDYDLMVTNVGDEEWVKLVATYDDHYNEYKLVLRISYDVQVSNPDDVVTTINWQTISRQEREISAQIAEVDAQISEIERAIDEEKKGNLLRLELEQSEYQGALQWICRRKEDRKTTLYVVDRYSDRKPEETGETWLCRHKFSPTKKDEFELAIVTPVVRADRAHIDDLQETREILELMLEDVRSSEMDSQNEVESDDSLDIEDAANALRKAWGLE